VVDYSVGAANLGRVAARGDVVVGVANAEVATGGYGSGAESFRIFHEKMGIRK
jgi:hypothetical protein